jgi:hypothetical protein
MTVTINGTTGIAGVDGSAATPAVQGGDTNTGVFYPVADTVAISTSGTERMRVTSTGVNLNGSTSGTLTIAAPAVAGTNTITFPAATDTVATLAATQTLTNKTIQGGAITSATAQVQPASPSAVANVDFTGIPSYVKRITVMFSGVSTNGTSTLQIQLGAGSITSTGYISTSVSLTTGAAASITSGFSIIQNSAATDTIYGSVVINTLGSNIWTETGLLQQSTSSRLAASAGGVTLGGTLDRVRITTVLGVDTFDAGTINIMYE